MGKVLVRQDSTVKCGQFSRGRSNQLYIFQRLDLMHLIRLLDFFAAHHNFWFRAIYFARKDTKLADALSRDSMSSFISQVPQTLYHPS